MYVLLLRMQVVVADKERVKICASGIGCMELALGFLQLVHLESYLRSPGISWHLSQQLHLQHHLSIIDTISSRLSTRH